MISRNRLPEHPKPPSLPAEPATCESGFEVHRKSVVFGEEEPPLFLFVRYDRNLWRESRECEVSEVEFTDGNHG